jgi:hypothetical protein
MSSVIVFACSLFGLVGLWALRRAEMRRGARFAPRARAGADALALRAYAAARSWRARHLTRERALSACALCAVRAFRLARRTIYLTRRAVARLAPRLVARVRGRAAAAARSAGASDFLRKVSSYRESGRGCIEEVWYDGGERAAKSEPPSERHPPAPAA